MSVPDFAERLIEWLQQKTEHLLDLPPEIGHDEEAGQVLLDVPLCVSCGPLRIVVGPGDEVEVEARTTPGGPGYHEFVCGLLDQMADELSVRWDEVEDDAGFFGTRDRGELERRMLDWFQALCRAMSAEEGPPDRWAICMPVGFNVCYPDGARILTPLGPRSLEWMRECAENAGTAEEFFQWWGSAEDARALLNRALALMWNHVVWAPAATERAQEAQLSTLDVLCDAYRADPTVDIPWREFEELIEIVGVAEENEPETLELVRLVAEMAERAPEREPIGYLRHEVDRMPMGPWRVRLPGSMCTELEDETTFLASDGERTFRLSAGTFEGDAHSPTRELLESLTGESVPGGRTAPFMEWKSEGHHGMAFVSDEQEDGDEYHSLSGVVTTSVGFAYVTICFDDPADQAWAEGVWRGIRSEQLAGAGEP